MKLFLTFGLAVLALFIFSVNPVSAAQTAALLPISDGNYTQWTPKSGVSHFAMVDEAACNANTDYNSTTTIGNRDSYGVSLATVPNGATITQLDLTPCASKDSGGGTNTTLNVFYRLNGVNSADAGGYILTNTTPSVKTATVFSGLSTVKSPTTILEQGAVFSAGNKGARLSHMTLKITYTALATPSALNAVSSGSAVNLTWTDNSSNEDGFKVERSDNGGAFVQIGTASANISTYNDPSLADGSYAYRVRAYNSGADSGYTNTSNAVISTIVAPTNLIASSSAATVNLKWTDNASNEAGFKIERSDNGGAFVQIDTVGTNVTTYADPGLAVGSYTYKVRAYNGGGDSVYTSSVTAFVLAAPTSLSASTASGSVSLNWTDNSSNEDGFKIERRVSGVGSFVEIKSVTTNVHATTDNPAPGMYEYRIRAYKGTNRSDYTNTATTTVVAGPTGLTAFSASGSSSIVLNWIDNSSNEDGFKVERRVTGGSFSEIATVGVDVTTYEDPGLTVGNTYFYRVRAYKGIDTSAATATASATVQ